MSVSNGKRQLAMTAMLVMAFAGFAANLPEGCDAGVMSDAYWAVWTPAVFEDLGRKIEIYRKADGEFALRNLDEGTTVSVEQVSHSFRFGAHNFWIGRQPSAEVNRRYEENFARLFNQVTICFSWRGFEPAPGDPHFHTRPGDLEYAFTSGMREKMDARSRYLSSPMRSTDQDLEFAKSHGMIVHGHPLIWGSDEWTIPFWLYEQFCPEEEKAFLRLPLKDPASHTRIFAEWDWIRAHQARIKELFDEYSEEEIAARCPVYLANMKRLFAKRIKEILEYCGDRVDSWDVVNESSADWAKACGRNCENGKPLVKSRYGILPPNFTLEAFRTAAAFASKKTVLAINDNNVWWSGTTYPDQIRDLVSHGARIDMVGAQFHIFHDDKFRELVAGKDYMGMSNPDDIARLFARLSVGGRPVSLSEITIPSPGNTPEARQQQAIVAANLYRAWFAQPSCCGITWWHTLDGADKSGSFENGLAGVMDAEANPKPSYKALYDLIHREWHTALTVRAAAGGKVSFRGFRGTYRLSWRDSRGRSRSECVILK